eukprot:410783-Pyramimonas_sp.AAC.1
MDGRVLARSLQVLNRGSIACSGNGNAATGSTSRARRSNAVVRRRLLEPPLVSCASLLLASCSCWSETPWAWCPRRPAGSPPRGCTVEDALYCQDAFAMRL